MVSENVKKIIKERGIKQKTIAEKAGYSEKCFSAMLCGRKVIDDSDILRICCALEVTPNALFGM